MQKPLICLLSGVMCDQTVWRPAAAVLARFGNVRIFDFFRFDDICAMARSVLQDSGTPLILIGHSMGARVALHAAWLAPERVRALALLDTGIHPPRPGEAEKRHALLDGARTHGRGYLTEHWLLPMLAPANRRRADMVGPLAEMIGAAGTGVLAGHTRALLNRPDAGTALASVRCPLFLGVGEHDEWSPPTQHAAMQQAAPHARLHLFAGCGHMAPFEDGQAVGAALADWLAALPTEAGAGRTA